MSATWTEIAPEDIAGILAGARKRGQYLDLLKEFDTAEIAGVKMDLENGPLAGKSATTVYAGFNNMLTKHEKGKEIGERVQVRKIGEDVYLVRVA